MPNLIQINESNLLPINNPNLFNPFSTFDSDYTWTIVSGSGTAINKTQSRKTGARGLQLKSLVTDGLTCSSALTEVTIAEDGQHILSFKLREDADGLNDNIMVVNVYVNGLLIEYELLLSGNTSDWKTYTQVIQLEAGDVVTYGFTIATNDVGAFYIVSVDDFKLEFDTNGSGIPSVYTPSYDNGLYLVQVTDNVYTYTPFLQNYTNTEILALTPFIGQFVYNTTLNQICFYDGTEWKKLSNTTM
jgi:hypothetical protein